MSHALPGPKKITSQGEKLLTIIRSAPEWISRGELATALNKRRLTPWDVAMLGVLADEGLIEVTQRPAAGPSGQEWVYRGK